MAKNIALLAGAVFLINYSAGFVQAQTKTSENVKKTEQSNPDSLKEKFSYSKELLDLEKQAGFDVRESHYKTLDSLIKKAAGYVHLGRSNDAKKDAVENLVTIDALFKNNKNAIDNKNLLLSDALNSKNFNSFHYLVLYLDVASRKNLPLTPMKAGENIFVKYNFENSSYLNWETSFGIEQKDEVYKKLLKNSETQEIKEIAKDELLAMEDRNIGESFNEDKEYKKAIEYFERASILNSEDFKSYKYQGDSWLALNNFNKAVENYNLAIGLNSQFAEAYVARANLYYKEKSFGWALKDYSKAIELGYQTPEIYKIRAELLIKLDENKGDIWSERKIPEQAQKDYLKILEMMQMGK